MTTKTDTVVDMYEIVVGLEVHAQLNTNTKIFSSDSTKFGTPPNTNISAISLGLPGTLPKLNKKVVESALKMGVATHCAINQYTVFARKNYFYADLPKGYQISQDLFPICINGYVNIKQKDGSIKKIGITRIHMEEDAGKSMHDQHPDKSSIDLNRAGVPLVEIVSEPDIRSGDEAYAFLTEIRKIVRYLGICDGNMEEGSMRCDANVSVRKNGDTKLGTRCEVKNLNSIRNVQRVIEYEARRQIGLIEEGIAIEQNTLNFDAAAGTTSAIRTKEMANDYRYFPEPDLQPIQVSNEWLAALEAGMPALPEQLLNKYVNELGLSEYDAQVITAEKELSDYFEKLIDQGTNPKSAANWLMGPVKSYLNERGIGADEFPVPAPQLAEVITLVDNGKINNQSATQKLLPALIAQPNNDAITLASTLNLLIESDSQDVLAYIDDVLTKYPDKVVDYHNGKKGVTGLFMGEIMKLSKGKINPQEVNKLLTQKLNEAK